MPSHTAPRRDLRQLPKVALALAILFAGSLVTTADADPAGAACASPSTKQLGGTLLGEDGRYLSALVGIELFNSAKQPIGMDGCLKGGGYTTVDRVNEAPTGNGCCFALDHNGADSGEKTWNASSYGGPLPSNAAYAWIEVYPETKATNLPTYERYGGTMRRFVPITTGIDLRLPLGCGLGAGGDNGSINGRVVNRGRPVAVNEVLAWSRAADGLDPIMGFGVQPGRSDGTFTFAQASPGQRYALRLETAAGGFWVEHDYGPGIPVSPCRATGVTIDVGYDPPRITPVIGDDTVGVRRATEVLLTNNPSGGAASTTIQIGQDTDRVVSGDWDGDGVDTLGLRRGNTFILTNQPDGSSPYSVFGYGWSTDTPVVGDWDGDGRDTIGVRRGNAYYLRNSNNGGPAHLTYAYGRYGDTPVTGDWDGNGTDTPGIRRGNAYYLRNVHAGGTADYTFAYGTYGDTPVTGDWDGNGTDTPGVRRGNQYYLRNSNTSGVAHLTFSFGWSSDLPLVGDWDGG
jgi:hypothetical protein